MKEPKNLRDYSSLYGQFISTGGERKPPEKQGWYVSFCRRAGRIFGGAAKFKNEDYRVALDFLGWDLKPREVNAAPILAFFLSMLVCFGAAGYVAYLVFVTGDLPFLLFMYAAMPLVIAPFLITFYIQSYPLRAANAEKMRSITYIPEIVNYLVMSMKLTPNLEKAVEFAAEHGRGKIADDFRRLSWETKVGTYRTVEEGLDALAYRWGRYSDEFKHALMLIRSSVIEIDEAKRNLILDKAVSDTLEGIRDDMDKYAIEMRQPSIYLYYVGVLLPLMLIIMLPIGSMMAKLPLAQTWILIAMYNVGIPLGTIFFASNILTKRPPVYVPPKIPDNYPGLPPKGHFRLGKNATIPAILVAIAAAAIIYYGFTYVLEPMLNPVPEAWDVEAVKAHTPYFATAGIILAACIAISIYLYGTAIAKRKVQQDVMAMEAEFQDSIYVIASRLGENRPIEEAITYASDFLSGTRVAAIFQKTSENISTLGMTVETALFDPVYGALRNVPSEQIRGAMRIVVDSISLGVQQAARALLSLSLQLRDSQKVKEKIASLLEEITAMMKSIAFLIAPLVLGITTALQRIIISALKSVGGAGLASLPQGTAVQGLALPSLPVASLGDPAMLETIPDPVTFLVIMAVYVVEITVALIYFTSRIEEGDNNLALKISVARSLPIALILFFAAAWLANNLASVVVT